MTLDHGKSNSVTIDHVVPRASGGSNRRDNQVGACDICNMLKANLSRDEFLAAYPMLLHRHITMRRRAAVRRSVAISRLTARGSAVDLLP
jgi:uncharacterized protein (DUF433 family)